MRVDRSSIDGVSGEENSSGFIQQRNRIGRVTGRVEDLQGSSAKIDAVPVADRQGRVARVIFCVHDGQMVLLHAFMKKTQTTPKGDLELAIRRMKEIT